MVAVKTEIGFISRTSQLVLDGIQVFSSSKKYTNSPKISATTEMKVSSFLNSFCQVKVLQLTMEVNVNTGIDITIKLRYH